MEGRLDSGLSPATARKTSPASRTIESPPIYTRSGAAAVGRPQLGPRRRPGGTVVVGPRRHGHAVAALVLVAGQPVAEVAEPVELE